MAIVDSYMTYAEAQPVTASGNATNCQAVGSEIGAGERLYVLFQAAAPFTGTGSIQFNLVAADSADLATGQAVLASSPVIPAANVTAVGPIGYIAIPPAQTEAVAKKKFFGVTYTVSGSVNASVSAYGTMDLQAVKLYPVGWLVK